MQRLGHQFVLALLLAVAWCPALAQAAQPFAPIGITKVRVVLNQGLPAVEITSTRPIAPQSQKLENPPRVVVDLPDAMMSVQSKRIDVQNDAISAVRLEQHQKSPPVVRVVLDMLKPNDYATESAGNVLTIRLRAPQSPGAPTPEVPTLIPEAKPVAMPVSPGSPGAVMVSGNRIANGSALTAGSETAVLRLGRGGEVRVCPGTTLSVTASKSGGELMLSMSTGALETHYSFEQGSDTVLTPDFRIQLVAPGEFDFAVSADARGNTCVRSLPGNTGPAVVSELIGNGTRVIKPGEQLLFHSGQVAAEDKQVPLSCGCPPPPIPTLLASAQPPPDVSDSNLPLSARLSQARDPERAVPPPASTDGLPAGSRDEANSAPMPESAPLPPDQKGQVHVQVDAPLIFRASDLPPATAVAAPAPPPDPPIAEAARLPIRYARTPEPIEAVVAPPPKPAKKPKSQGGFFGKIKGLFSGMFH